MSKKFIKPPFNYSTSKYNILNRLVSRFDYNKTTFIDLFTGSGCVYANVLDKYDKILANDIVTDIMMIHKQLTLSDRIIDTVKVLVPEKDDTDEFVFLRDSYNETPTPAKLWALMLCSNSLRFDNSNNLTQLHGHRTLNSIHENNIREYAAYIKQYKNKIIYKNWHFKNVPLTTNAFYFIDAPYGYKRNKDGSIGKTQIINSGDKVHYTQNDEQLLYDYIHKLHNAGATFMIYGLLNYDGKESWLLNKLFEDGFSYNFINTKYKRTKKKYKEIIIYNY